MRRVALVVMAVTAAAAAAHADGLDLPPGARAVARAGAAMIVDDGGAALYGDPAALARRTSLRLQLGLALTERSAHFASAATFAKTPAEVESRGDVALLPWGAVAFGVGDRLVLAAAVLQPTAIALDYATIDSAYDPDPARDDRAAIPQRYAATRLHLARWGVGAGAAVRVLPWLAVGVSGLALRTHLEHGRVLWAGAPSPGAGLGDLSPAYDMAFSADASAWSPAVGGGVIAAPPDLPIELGASLLWQGAPSLSGRPSLRGSRGVTGGRSSVVAAVAPGASASLELPAPMLLRAGVRVLLPRVVVEVDAEHASITSAAPAWAVTGVTATPDGGSASTVGSVPLGPAFEPSFSVRAAADVALIPGAVTLVAGYGYSQGPLAATSIGPALPDDDRHTLSVGIEGRVDAATLTLGIAHGFSPDREVQPGDARVIDPLGPIDTPAAAGRIGSGVTVVALDLELELL